MVRPQIKAKLDLLKLFIEAGIYLNYFLGQKELIVVKGNLKEGVTGAINVVFAKGSVTFYIKNGYLYVKLALSSPLFPTMDTEFKLIKICKFG